MQNVIVIGGTDSSGGAGVSRDAATLASLGVNALPVVTAVTAQTDQNVRQVQLMAPDLVAAQLACALEKGEIGAIKIGMLGNKANVALVAELLGSKVQPPIVLDPVLVSSSGTRLLELDGEDALKTKLLPLCELVTPNLLEAAMLTGVPIGDGAVTLEKQAFYFRALGVPNVLIKGGHSSGERVVDAFFDGWGDQIDFVQNRQSGIMRGTGCMLASAIAGQLAQGVVLKTACRLAQQMVGQAFVMQNQGQLTAKEMQLAQ